MIEWKVKTKKEKLSLYHFFSCLKVPQKRDAKICNQN